MKKLGMALVHSFVFHHCNNVPLATFAAVIVCSSAPLLLTSQCQSIPSDHLEQESRTKFSWHYLISVTRNLSLVH